MLELDAPHPTPDPSTVAAKGRRSGPPVDLQALAAHYTQAYARLRLQAVGIVGSGPLADDIVQDAFTIATAKIKEGVEIRDLGAWMRTVVRNLAIDGLTRKGRERRTFSPLPDEPQTAAPGSPPDVVHLKRGCEAVYRAVEDLTPAQRSAFVLAELRGFKYAEIAADLHRTEQAVRDLLVRARERIRTAVGPDAIPLNLPLAGAELRGMIEPRSRAHAVGDYVAAKLANLQAAVSSLLQRSAEFVSQPAAPLVAGALVAGGITLAVSGPQAPMPVAGGNAPPVALAPQSPSPTGVERSADRGAALRPLVASPAPAPVGDAGAKPQTPSTGAGDRNPRPDVPGSDKQPHAANTASAEAQGSADPDEGTEEPGDGPAPEMPNPYTPLRQPPAGGSNPACMGAGCETKGGAGQDEGDDVLSVASHLGGGVGGTDSYAENVASQGGGPPASGDPSPAGGPTVNGAPAAPVSLAHHP